MPETWALVDFTVREAESELVSDALWSMGVLAVEERPGLAGFVSLRTSLGANPENQIARVCSQFETVTAQIVNLSVDVTETWRQFAEPTMIDEHLALVPAWITPPTGVFSVLIEPHDTFGLGNHPTTVLALRSALRHSQPSDSVFDFGCGSGVLAIALAHLRGNDCDVFDIADSSRSTVAGNCVLNHVSNVRWNDDFADRRYDVVVANILAPVLRAEAAQLSLVTRKGGIIILSGMREDQVHDVVDTYEGFDQIDEETSLGWSCVALRKNSEGA